MFKFIEKQKTPDHIRPVSVTQLKAAMYQECIHS